MSISWHRPWQSLTLSCALLLAACGGGDPGASSTATDTSSSARAQAQAVQSTDWSLCAVEGKTCSFTGTKTVRYGHGDRHVYKTATGPVACGNGAFGDPYAGVAKACDTAPAVSTAASWSPCAVEGGQCAYAGSREVRYGANGRYFIRTVDGGVACGNAEFGDPAPYVRKSCEVGSPAQADEPSPYGQDAAAYVLTFRDEFEGAVLDPKTWNTEIWYRTPNPTQNFAVADGSLKIWPQRDANGNFFNRTIDTDGKYYQTYGYFEIEAKLPRGKGTWPAFWLLNHDEPDPMRPEIDIMEAYAGGGADKGWSDDQLHPTTYAATVWPTGAPEGIAGSLMVQDLGDLSASFHKYAVKWEPGRQTFYFDGKPVYSLDVAMGRRMYLLLDLWFGSASGEPDATTPTGPSNAYEVRYVRAWRTRP